MMSAEPACRRHLHPADEPARQESVERYGLSGRTAWDQVDPRLASLVRLTRQILGTDFAAINILDRKRQWAVTGGGGSGVLLSPRSISICQRLLTRVHNADVLVLPDASVEADFWDSPWVNGDIGAARFYAAIPLVGRDGYVLGTVCAWSVQPGELSEDQRVSLRVIADAVMRHLDARRDALQAVEPQQAELPGAWTIDRIIDQRAIRSVFQPVVHIASGEIIGFEALSRGPANSGLEAPADLLAAADAEGRLADLDWVCRALALGAASAARLPAELAWFVNVEPTGLATDPATDLRGDVASAGPRLRAVLEIVERGISGHVLDLLHETERARAGSCSIALDDLGAAPSSLALLPLLRPDVVKLDMSLLTRMPDAASASVTAAARAYAERTGAVIVAEGVETEEQEQLAIVFGATYAQGFRYGAPAELPETLPVPQHPLPTRAQLALGVDTGTPFETLAATHASQIAPESMLMHISRHLEKQAAVHGDSSVLMASYHGSSQFVLVDDRDELDTGRRFNAAATVSDSSGNDEWTVLVARPHFTGAFVARRADEPGTYEYIYTHDADAVALAAHAFVDGLLAARQSPRR